MAGEQISSEEYRALDDSARQTRAICEKLDGIHGTLKEILEVLNRLDTF